MSNKELIKQNYERLGGCWDDVELTFKKYPTLIEAVQITERNNFKQWINHTRFSKGMTKKGDKILDFFEDKLKDVSEVKDVK